MDYGSVRVDYGNPSVEYGSGKFGVSENTAESL